MIRSSSVFIALLAVPAYAQVTAQITGSITDKTGAAVAGAEITVRNASTGNERKVASNDVGLYTVPSLTPDIYSIAVTKTGFRQIRQENIRLDVNQVARLDFQLEVGQVTETVNVMAAAPLLESDTSSLGQVIEQKAIEDLPLNGRNFVGLALLSPGVVGVTYGPTGTIMGGARPDDQRPASELFANGNREGSNNFLYDGADNNERLTLSIVLRPSVEAVREFKMQTNLFGAEQGRNSGATVNVISKSGTNEWHGSAYEFLRNEHLDARNYFSRPDAPAPALRQNQFGATFGGKIVPNKLFFFANYEGFRQSQERTDVNTVPLPEVRRGDFSNVRDIFDPMTTRADASLPSGYRRDPFPGRQIPANRFDSVTLLLIQAYPLPQRAGLTNNHTTNPKRKQTWDQGDLRLDWNWNEKNTVFGRFSRQDTLTIRPSTFQPVTIPGMSVPVGLGNEDTFAGESTLKTYNSVVTWIHTFAPTWILESKVGFARFNLVYLQEGASPGAQLGEKLGVRGSNQGPQSDGIPIFSPSGYTGIGQTRSLPIYRIENTYHPNAALTNIRGRHTLKTGLEVRRRQVTQYQTNRGNGRFNFSRTFTDNPNQTANTGDAMAGLLLGAASTIEQDFTLVFPGMRLSEWGAYAHDDWKVSDKLTLNIGLRYEYDTRVTEVANRQSNFDVVTGKLLIAGFNTDAETGISPDRNNFAPRFGFAYRLRPKTVIRGGYGIFYNPAGSERVLMRRHRQLPFGPINAESINQFNPNPRRVQDGFRPIPNLDFKVVADNPEGNMLAVVPNYKSGYAQQMNFQVQQELPKDMVVKIGYVGNLARSLDTVYNYNQQAPGPGAPDPRRPLFRIARRVLGVDYNVSDARSNYHAMQASAEKRFASGLGFLASYSWAHSIDIVDNSFGGAANGPFPQDARNRNADRGNSGFDITHRLVYSANYALPFGKGRKWSGNAALNAIAGGWNTNVIWTAQTGLPFTPTLANASIVNAGGGSRPERFKAGTRPDPDPALWFDTSFNVPGAAWGLPLQYTYGNGGRNILRGPGRINFDWSVFKDFSWSEKWHLQYRAEFFNLFNTPQFALPNASIGDPNAGRITSLAGIPRQIQMGLRLSF